MFQSIGEELESFYNFLKYPRQDIFKGHLTIENFFPILLTYYIVFICGIIVMAPLAAIAGLEDMPHALQDLQDMNKWLLILLAVITQPFLEELMFRFPLKYYRLLLALICTMAGMVLFLILGSLQLDIFWGSTSLAEIIAIGFTALSIILLMFFINQAVGKEH